GDGHDLLPAAKAGGVNRAAVDRSPIDHDGTRATLGTIAAEIRAGHAEIAGHRFPQRLANVDGDVMLEAVDVERYAPHGGRQLRLGWRLRRGLWLLLWRGLGLWRRCNGHAWSAWPGLDSRRRDGLRASARNGDAGPGHDADDDCPGARSHEEVAPRGQRTDVLAAGRVDFGRLRARRTTTFWHTNLPSRGEPRDGQNRQLGVAQRRPQGRSIKTLCAGMH